MSEQVRAIYKSSCPNCGEDISDLRLRKGLPCSKCYNFAEYYCKHKEILKNLRNYCEFNEELRKFISFFKKKIGDPWSLQISWARRVLLGRSFALVAPTGVGKTTFGTIMAQYLKGKRYMILPSKLLVEQVSKRINALAYHSELTKKKKEEVKKRIEAGDFEILATTSMFLWKNFDILKKNTFDFIFVDDVDSVLKRDKNIDRILYLLGYTQNDISLAMQIIRLKSNWEKNKERIEELKKKIKKRKGVLVVSSATTKVKSRRAKLFSELLEFEVGTTFLSMRNIEDIYFRDQRIVKLIKDLGGGCLLFTLSKGEVEEWVRILNESGIKAVRYEEFEKFEQGKAEVAVGIASVRNPMARGIDLPHLIRYVIFTGVPKFKIKLSTENEQSFLPLLINLRDIMQDKDREKVERYIYQLKGKKANIIEIRNFLEEKFKDREFIQLIEKSDDVSISCEDNSIYLVVADVASYIQASGRCSRLYAGGISKGASFILVDDEKAFRNLKKKARWYYEDIEFKPLENIDLKSLFSEIDRDREKIVKYREGKASKEEKEFIKSALVIVESPTKAKTISNFFGRSSKRRIGNLIFYETNTGEYFLTLAYTQGHFYDLVKDYAYHGVIINKSIIPVYEKIKEGIIEAIRELSKEVDLVLIATDPDIEGEKIAYDVYCNLKPFVSKIVRAEFHEVTRRAFLEALKSPRGINENLVEAQLVRRISDRWVGFELSQTLWRKFGSTHLSAGRVQTPVLGWVIQRSKEAKKRICVTRIKTEFGELSFEEKVSPEEVEIRFIEKKEEILNPPPPFSTENMIKEVNSKLKLGVEKIMNLAQELFEMGLITYHRTDSTRVSEAGLRVARNYIEKNIDPSLYKPRKWGEGGAHECIRPTRPLDPDELKSMVFSGIYKLSRDHLALYSMIFKRFIASQMREVKIEKVKFKALPFSGEKEAIVRIVEHGFDKVLGIPILPVKEGRFKVLEIRQFFKPKVFPFTQGSLVEEMKARGLGRPSTYATIVQTLLNRGYVIERKGFLFPTKRGIKVFKFLKREFGKYVSEKFTRELEQLMDRVEGGEEDYQKILKKLAGDFLAFAKKSTNFI